MRAVLSAGAALFLAFAPAPAVFAQAVQSASPANRDALIAEIRRDLPQVSLPAADSITTGARAITAGTTISGPIATWGGDLEVLGTVNGDVVAIDGDVIVGDSGRVNGNVLAVRGDTRITGTVAGSVMRLEGNLAVVPVAPVGARVGSTWRPLGVALGTLGMLLVMGIGVLIFAGPTLESVVEVLEQRLSRSFMIGIGAELALLPGLLLLCVALAVTVLGVLLIPFAIVAYALAVAGAVTLGFLAVAAVVGGAIGRRRASAGMTTRAASLRAMMIGVVTLLVLWVVAAAFVWSPLGAAIVRLVAAAFTWVAVTAGFGAVILSRIGSRRVEAHAEPEVALDDLSWQTPTPVSGVAAARRPTPIASGKAR